MSYVVLIHATFETKAHADHIYDQAMTVATNASVSHIGQAGERTSYGGVYEEMPDGSLVPDRRFHIDRFGIVRSGQLIPDDQIPEWIQPQGAQDAYPLTDVRGSPVLVSHNGSTWQNTVDVNTQAPGVNGWINLSEEPEEPVDPEYPEGYPAWQPWTSGLNEDLYQIGDRVSHNEFNWEATAGNNHWEPGGGYGWVKL